MKTTSFKLTLAALSAFGVMALANAPDAEAGGRGCGVDYAHRCAGQQAGTQNNNTAAGIGVGISDNRNNNSNSNRIGVTNNITGGNTRAYGGQGGQGGQGGAGYGYGGQGGASSSDANSSATATGGAAHTGNNQINIEGDKFPMPIGMAPPVYLNNGGNCPEGWSISVGAPFSALGVGRTTQDTVCLSAQHASGIMNAGLVANDQGLIATGVAGLSQIFPEIAAAVETVSGNLVSECYEKAASRSAVLLAKPQLNCEAFK